MPRSALRKPAPTADDEVMVAKTVKLPRSLDDRLRQYSAVARRTGQDVMLEAIRRYLDSLQTRGRTR